MSLQPGAGKETRSMKCDGLCDLHDQSLPAYSVGISPGHRKRGEGGRPLSSTVKTAVCLLNIMPLTFSMV